MGEMVNHRRYETTSPGRDWQCAGAFSLPMFCWEGTRYHVLAWFSAFRNPHLLAEPL